LRQKSSDIFWGAFFGRVISGEALLAYNFVPSNWLWSGFINPPPPFGFFSFPRKESFDLNRKKKAPKKRTRFGRKFPPEWAGSDLNPFKGGPFSLEKENHEFLGSKRDDRFSNPVFEMVPKTCQGSFFVPALE